MMVLLSAVTADGAVPLAVLWSWELCLELARLAANAAGAPMQCTWLDQPGAGA